MSQKKTKLWEKNLYDLFGVEASATESDIKKAYRKKALKYHPDKNPDNPKAAELFLELSAALEILQDPKAKEAYDRILKAKAAAKIRHQALDSKRQKLREDLERREKDAAEARAARAKAANMFDAAAANEEALEKEIERLKKEGAKFLMEEQFRREREAAEAVAKARGSSASDEQEAKRRKKEATSSNPAAPASSGHGPTTPSSFADFEALILGKLSDAARAQNQSNVEN